EITFLNDTGSAITVGTASCPNSSICAATFTASGTPTISSFTFTVNSMGQQGIGIDFDLKNAISLSGGTLSVNFNPSSPNPAVLSAVALPRMNANLGTNQLALIEDFIRGRATALKTAGLGDEGLKFTDNVPPEREMAFI